MSSSRKVSRRAWLASTAGAAAGALAAPVRLAASAGPDTVDQNTVRRRGVGLRALDPARACPGFTLFAPMGGQAIHLIDLHGDEMHAWTTPYRPGLYGYLTERGTMLFNGQIPNETFLGKSPFMGGAILEMDWNGRVLWEVRRPDHHHDARRLRNGNLVLLCARELPKALAARVKGGRPGSEATGGAIWGDYLVELTTKGELVWEWRAWEHLDPDATPITAAQDDRSEWTHANGVFEEPDGNLLVSFRNISTVIRIDRRTGRVAWRLGAPPLSGQHAPVRLPNGHVLIFDNGPHRLDESFPCSRVIEVDPASDAIAWQYREPRPYNFFSPRISNAERLPNGNTLVNEGLFGRFFEVTPSGDVVWEFVNPHFGPQSADAKMQTNSVFRVYRYSADEIERARRV